MPRIWKNSASALQTLWRPGYYEDVFICGPLLTYPKTVSVLEGGRKSARIGLAMGVTMGGDAAKSGHNTHLLVIMHARLSQKIGLHNLTNRI